MHGSLLHIEKFFFTIATEYLQFVCMGVTSHPKSLQVAYRFSYVDCAETGFFSKLVTDYLGNEPGTQPFYSFYCDEAGMDDAIAERANFPVDRVVLCNTLQRQYNGLEIHSRVQQNLELLANDNTYTVCTAHQPNLLTGYLYFIYKIIHAIKLADVLNERHPEKHFVPVYYMGSEDNDIEELGVFRFRGDKYVWDGDGQKGAVGRMSTKGLKKLLDQLFRTFGPPGANCDRLQQMITDAYLNHATIGAATQFLVNELFGRFGLVILDPDDAAFKHQFIPVMEDELLNRNAQPIIARQIVQLGEHYKIQAHPREINLFYLTDQIRERIEYDENGWWVVNTDIRWTREEILAELYEHPERFSPNVMLRGLYQETILPDVVFIGGGAEVAYWMQLKTLFGHYNGFLPCILLRQSIMVEDKIALRLQEQLGLNDAGLFAPINEIEKEIVARLAGIEWQTTNELAAMEQLLQQLQEKATAIDATLKLSAAAVLTRMKHQLQTLEQKMLRAEKKKLAVQMQRIATLKAMLFPGGGLTERRDNFSDYYLEYGEQFLDMVYEGTQPVSGKFLIIKC